MAFNLSLTLPGWKPGVPSPTVADSTDDFIDDDPSQPLFLLRACDYFAAAGVKFQISGFYSAELDLYASKDLVYFLEGTPGLLDFLNDVRISEYVIEMWGQGGETKLLFKKTNTSIEVNCSFPLQPGKTVGTEQLSYEAFFDQVLIFCKSYLEAIKRYYPSGITSDWNMKIIQFASQQTLH